MRSVLPPWNCSEEPTSQNRLFSVDYSRPTIDFPALSKILLFNEIRKKFV